MEGYSKIFWKIILLLIFIGLSSLIFKSDAGVLISGFAIILTALLWLIVEKISRLMLSIKKLHLKHNKINSKKSGQTF